MICFSFQELGKCDLPEIMAFCELCNVTAAEIRSGVLVDVKDQEISAWTFNIITIKYCHKLCMKCCQNLSLVGELLFQWRNRVHVNLTAAEAPMNDSTANGVKVEQGFEWKECLRSNHQTEFRAQNANACIKEEDTVMPDTEVSQGDMKDCEDRKSVV